MAISQHRSLRKPTGGRYKKGYRKKKQFELGREPALTRIEKKRIKSVRTMGNHRKFRLLSQDIANLFDPKTKKYEKAKIKNVIENPANRHFVRRNIMTKGTVIETEKGKAEIVVVHADHRPAHETAAPDAESTAQRADEQTPLRVMPADLEVGVAEGLERGDLFALDGDDPAEHDVEQKAGDGEEDHRNEEAETA